MHVGLTIWGLHEYGGVQSDGTDIVNHLVERGYDVTIFDRVFAEVPNPVPALPLPEEAKIVFLNLDSDEGLAAARQQLIDSELDVLISRFSWRQMIWFPWLLRDTGIPLICSEHNFPSIISLQRMTPHEHFGCLAAADYIHVVLESFIPFYPESLHDRIAVISTCPETAKPVDFQKRENKPRRYIFTTGRFIEEHKQFSHLLKAFAILAPEFPDWDLVICGDGPEQKTYADLVETLGLVGRVSMPGFVDNETLHAYYADADIFCIPSRYEGFGRVTVEAAAHAVPAVGYAQCPATNEVIVHNESGLLAPSMTPRSLAATLKTLMEAPAEVRHRMGLRGQELLSRYTADIVYGKWEEVLKKAAAVKGKTRLQRLYLQPWSASRMVEATLEIVHRPHPYRKKAPFNPVNTPEYKKLQKDHAKLKKKYEKTLTAKITKAYKKLKKTLNW